MQYSTTIATLIVMVLGWFNLGTYVLPDEVGAVVDAILQLGGIVFLWYKRYKEGNITPLGFRK